MNDKQNVSIKTPLFLSLILLVLMLLISGWAWMKIPEGQKIPVHWNIDGKVDRWGGKFEGLLLMPLIFMGITFLFAFLPRLEPRKLNLLRSLKVYKIFWILILIVLFVVHVFQVKGAFGNAPDFASLFPFVMSLLFIVLGNYMGKIRSNWFLGIRTPWTLSSELSWKKTHRIGGILFVMVGVILLILSFAGNPKIFLVVMTVITGGVVIYLSVYSYTIWKSDPDKQSLGRG